MIYTLIAAISRDGFIASRAGKPLSTSASDKKLLREQLALHDVHLYGRRTFDDVLPKNNIDNRHTIYVLTRNAPQKEVSLDGATFVSSLTELFTPKKHEEKALILGGTSLYSYAVENRIATTIYLTVTAELLGGGTPFLQNSDLLTKNYTLVSTSTLEAGEELRIYQKLTSS